MCGYRWLMDERRRRGSAFNGFASFINGLTWIGQPPRRGRDRWDEEPATSARWEVPVALGVTLACALAGGIVSRGLAGEWGAAWLGVLAGVFVAAIVLQVLFPLLRRLRPSRNQQS